MSLGLYHTSVGAELTQSEYVSDGSHTLDSGTSFPGGPSATNLFYRSDENKWYMYTTAWTELTSQGNDLSSIGESLLPSGSYDIGSSGAKWTDLYLSGDISVDGTVDTVDIASFKSAYDAHDHSSADPTQVDYTDLLSIPGTFTPAPHVLATSGPHTGELADGDITTHSVGEVLAIISCSLDGPIVTSATSATVVDYTDFLVNISDFPANAKAIMRIVWKNSGNNTNNMDLYDQFGAAPVSSSAESEAMATDVFEISETDAAFALPAGLKSFQVRLWCTAGTLTASKIELQIERAA